MKSWSDIRETILTIISLALGIMTIVGPVILTVWAVWTGHYITAGIVAITYLTIFFVSFNLKRRCEMDNIGMEEEHGIKEHSDLLMRRTGIYTSRKIAEPYCLSPVNFSVFAPRCIAHGETFILNLWVHLQEQIDTVFKLAQLLKPSDVVGFRAGVPVELGTEIVFLLHMPTLCVLDKIDKVIWTGTPTNALFRIEVPPDTKSTVHDGHFDVLSGGIRIARVLFGVKISHEVQPTPPWRLQTRLEWLRTAFASYSSVDRVEVLGRIHGMTKIAPDLDVFLDALSLRSGDLWESRLAKEVISKDVFYLFWSRNAAKSAWVRKEWQHALAIRGIDYIDPVPLEIPEVAPPPDELSALHFGDAFATFAFLQKGTVNMTDS